MIINMEKKYILELTREELKLIDRALIREGDYREASCDPTYKDVENLEDVIHGIYMNARQDDDGWDWIHLWNNAERDRV